MSDFMQTGVAAAPTWRASMKELVHKLHDEEVLLTGWCRESPQTYLISASWPNDHVLYAPPDGALDPLLVTETIRQAGLLMAHVGLEVPIGRHFIWEGLEFALDATAPRMYEYTNTEARREERHVEVDVRVHVLEVVRRGAQTKRVNLGFALDHRASALATGTVRVSFQDPQVYRRIRAIAGGVDAALDRALPVPPPIQTRLTGRQRRQDVVLSAADGYPGARTIWRLRLDTGHPVLFDHPIDHVPGTVLVEAASQAARAFHHPAAAAVTAIKCEFNRYVELDAPCLVEVEPAPARLPAESRLRVRFRQQSAEPSCVVDVTLVPAAVAARNGRAGHASLPMTALPAQGRPLSALRSSR